MISAERSFAYAKMFITCGIFDTLEHLGAEDIASPKKNEVVECRLTVYGKTNCYRFTVHALPYGCLLRIELINPDNSLSAGTQKRLLHTILSTLEQLIEDAVGGDTS